jgi:hypothetical protein
MSLNLHNIVGNALTIVNDWQDLVFTKTMVEWVPTSREPVRTTQTLNVKGKIQPASLQELRETGFNLQEYQYFKVFISGEPTQLDRLRQFGSDTFTCGGYTYQVVAKEAWDDAGWREIYAYRVDYEAPDAGK